jgi:hypothetical protein
MVDEPDYSTGHALVGRIALFLVGSASVGLAVITFLRGAVVMPMLFGLCGPTLVVASIIAEGRVMARCGRGFLYPLFQKRWKV